jgi:hypothetical protein
MLRGLLLALCALAVIAPAAVAADDEIFVDPDSPSGKEYALPVDSARKQAAGAAQGAKDATAPTPLFGEGVEAAGSKATTRTSKASGAGAKAGSDDGATAAAGASTARARTAAPKTLKAQAAAPDGGIGVAAVIGGVSVGVLLLGAAIGVLLRRRATRSA